MVITITEFEGGLPSVALMDKICKNRAMLIEMRDSKLPPSEVITLGKERLVDSCLFNI